MEKEIMSDKECGVQAATWLFQVRGRAEAMEALAECANVVALKLGGGETLCLMRKEDGAYEAAAYERLERS